MDVGREDELVEVDLVVLHLEVLELDEGKPEYVPSRADDSVDVVCHRPVHKLYPGTRQTSDGTKDIHIIYITSLSRWKATRDFLHAPYGGA